MGMLVYVPLKDFAFITRYRDVVSHVWVGLYITERKLFSGWEYFGKAKKDWISGRGLTRGPGGRNKESGGAEINAEMILGRLIT